MERAAGVLGVLIALTLAAACGSQADRVTSGSTLAEKLLAQPVASPLAARPPAFDACGAPAGFRCYDPPQVYRAYDLAPIYRTGVFGQGRTIAILDSFGSPTIRSDLRAFDAAFHLPPARLEIVAPAGQPPAFDGSPDRVGWASETSLDVEWAHAIAPLARIVLVETPTDETEGIHGMPEMMRSIDSMVVHERIDVYSMSFGATEGTFERGVIARLRGAIVRASRGGSTLVAASGDVGAAGYRLDLDGFFAGPQVSWPASDPLVTAVGGTDLNLDATGRSVGPLTAWGDDSGASGGGLSAVFGRPAYQRGLLPDMGDHRLIPDLAVSGSIRDGVVIRMDGRWRHIGGTSAATPILAGVVALADAVTGRDLGNINPALYRLAARRASGVADVTLGNNSFGGVRGYRAGPGYDLVTGLGTIDAAELIRSLAVR